MNEQVSGWLSGVEGLPDVRNRLIRVLIENMDVIDLFRREQKAWQKMPGSPLKFLYYYDPPYMHETRAVKKLYNHEWTVQKHEEFLGECTVHEGDAQIMISGYATPLYDSVLSDWNRETFKLPNNMGGQSTKREMTEVIYYNF